MDKTPGSPGTGGPKRTLKSLPLGELKSLFFSFFESQGYGVPAEANSILNDVGSASSASSREQSPSSSVCSGKRTSRAISSDEGSEQSDTTVKGSDEEEQEDLSFKVIQRKCKRVARRLRKSSNESRDSDMDTEPCKGKPMEYTDSPASPVPFISQKSVVGHKQTTLKQNPTLRKLNTLLIKSDLPFHTYALEEERKVKAVLKGTPFEFETKDIKLDLQRQGYPVLAVHRMHRRDRTALGMSLIILERCDRVKDIFKKLSNDCALSGGIVEAPYRRGKPDQCHRCQLYGYAAANCHAQSRCVKCLVPHWTKDCNRNRESVDKPSCCNCGKDHTVNYGRVPGCTQT
ncbi:Nucleic-acid-binding protein from transposon X-element [Eumeta japonica]|uniref:Nucleic-acid-binding protein from transposon X-element n=1 Tax=Eumeta variegata TaxID=151549 RepID=A0A4C1XFQ0_EUMVA|nr:Nucleic-acid-binding protein from transposon X-element [Eumeta japonica]